MRVVKILLGMFAFLVVGILVGGIYLSTALPNVAEAPNINIEVTPERLVRGKYLANHVAVCIDCHSKRQWNLYSGPLDPKNLGAGGEIFNQDMGFPGKFISPNITPHALSNWTDGEIFRAITVGVNKEGKALFPVMAYHRFGQMDKEDLYSIIAYLRTIDPIAIDHPKSKPDFPVNFLINTFPTEAKLVQMPDKSNTELYGKYLINVAGCVDCHSQTKQGKIIPGTEFGGGMEFAQPAGTVRAPNITFHKETGIGTWTADDFVNRFKMYADTSYTPTELGPEDINTPMPWMMYAGMNEEDLKAIYSYLKSLKPIENTVVKFTKK